MAIDDIKPLGGFNPFPDPGADSPLQITPERSFADSHASQEPSQVRTSLPLLPELSGMDRASLEDPAKLDALVRSSASALVDANQKLTGELSPNEKSLLTDFFCNDPILRQQIETYLRKAL